MFRLPLLAVLAAAVLCHASQPYPAVKFARRGVADLAAKAMMPTVQVVKLADDAVYQSHMRQIEQAIRSSSRNVLNVAEREEKTKLLNYLRLKQKGEVSELSLQFRKTEAAKEAFENGRANAVREIANARNLAGGIDAGKDAVSQAKVANVRTLKDVVKQENVNKLAIAERNRETQARIIQLQNELRAAI